MSPPSSRGPIGLFAHALFVDLGYGFDARTTLESAARFRRVNPDLPILGVEIEKERVEAIRRRDSRDESLWVKTMVRRVCGIAGAKGI